ncbi:LpxL/LpxP family Kdo(2)-lipid IV(A) lauroyl/palmitoleoyl acyltransferase [Roseibacterium beibuensis]|uniref:LpxL/LpxP family Kdo(2)-lipid IV(A) lauroyl/palmitoleoyl acyltransferase n=2 Tax=[Roseibacterium] beibuensis TaxID=1193142 RepID=A0ABP9LK52_9RHOB
MQPGMSVARPRFPLHLLIRPRNWPILLLLGGAFVVAWLPEGARRALARPFGWGLWRIRRFRHVTTRNLEVCLPEMDDAARARLARDTTRRFALSLLQSLKVWIRQHRTRPAYPLARIDGQEHLDAALATGQGVLLLTGHYGAPEVHGSLTGQLPLGGRRLVGVYRQPGQDAADAVLRWARSGYCDGIIPGKDIRSIVRELRSGSVAWFAPDLEKANKGAVYVDFFGIPAGTTTATARLAGMGRAIVLPVRYREDPDGALVYDIRPPLADFPSDDIEADTRRVNAAIEDLIRDDPAPYWWCLERFLHRPEGAPPVY